MLWLEDVLHMSDAFCRIKIGYKRIQKVSIGFVVAKTNAGNIATTEL